MLKWYAGIKSDIEDAKNGDQIVLHADEDLCRILTCGSDKFSIYAYPSAEKMAFIAGSDETWFAFNNCRYYKIPSFKYIETTDIDIIPKLYRVYCETPIDAQFESFLKSRTASRRETDIVFSKDGLIGSYTLMIAHEGQVIGKVNFDFCMRETGKDNPDRRVTQFAKEKLIDDVYKLLVQYGNPPEKHTVRIFVNNILNDFAKRLRTKGIEFDHTLFG